jgi:hypothetical protein
MLQPQNKENEEYYILTSFVVCLSRILGYFVQDEQDM